MLDDNHAAGVANTTSILSIAPLSSPYRLLVHHRYLLSCQLGQLMPYVCMPGSCSACARGIVFSAAAPFAV
jgi:hypothetical protein